MPGLKPVTGKNLTASKLDWYEKFGIGIKADEPDAATVGIDDCGQHWGVNAHLTLYRNTWTRKFRPSDDTDNIMARIFGAGNGVHVTLENTGAPKDPRCYWKGPNFGRNDAEKQLLKDMLDFYVARARKIVEELKERYDEFVWPETDKPLDRLEWAPEDLFSEIAALASRKTGAEVVWPPQKDSALMWSAAAIHPLQSLQNTYQRIVRDACRPISDEEKKKEKEGEQLGNYYYFDAATPRLMGQPKDAEGGLEERLEKVKKDLSKLEQAIAEGEEVGTGVTAEARLRADRALVNLVSVRSFFANGEVPVPALEEADKRLKDVDTQLALAVLWTDLGKAHRNLSQAYREVERAYRGMCSIQNFHVIEPFYLFRLLVKFRIGSDGEIAATKRTEVSSVVTGLLHNNANMSWLFDWLRDKLVELDGMLASACGADVRFYLKGGRAAKYLQNLATLGENDWDTQIVINPHLRASEWYENFLKVHNIVLVFLQQAKMEFLIQVHAHQVEFGNAVEEWRAKERKAIEDRLELEMGEAIGELFSDREAAAEAQAEQVQDRAEEREADKEPALDRNKENCKAELIDIGLPRRDTVEAFEQWEHVVPDVFRAKGMPIPGHLYYIAEYVMMIRDAFADNSISMQKTPKRVVRLHEVLVLPDLARFVAREREHIPPQVLPLSVAGVDLLGTAEKSVLTVLLHQFSEAYDLDIDPELAKQFDALFSANLTAMRAKVDYPASLKEAIEAARDIYRPEHETLADAIGYAQWVAQEMGEHLAEERSAFLLENRAVFRSFVRAFYSASVFSEEDDLEVQFAVTGSFAALLHAEYAQFERMNELEPLRRLDLKIYCKPDADPETVRELVPDLVQKYLEQPQAKPFRMELQGKDSVCLYWPTEVKIGRFTYAPLAIKITVEKRAEDWPQVASIRGLPVLGLRDLIWEYKRYAGHIEENFTRRGLKTAIESLVDIVTRFENPAAGEAWERPGTPALAIPDVVLPMEPRPLADPPDVIAITPNGDCLFAAIARGAADRGLAGHTAMTLRRGVSEELKDSVYKDSIIAAMAHLLASLPRENDADAVLEAVGPRVGEVLRPTMRLALNARTRGEDYRWLDHDVKAYIDAVASATFFGGDLEANVAGGILQRGIHIHEDGHPPIAAFNMVDDNPIRLRYNGRDHYDLYRSGYVPGEGLSTGTATGI